MFGLPKAGDLQRSRESLLYLSKGGVSGMQTQLRSQVGDGREDVLGLHQAAQASPRALRRGGVMLKDRFGQCIVCFFDPCSCNRPRESGNKCSQCSMLLDEVDALRRELRRYRALIELEKDRRFHLERELLLTRVPPFRGQV